MLNVLSATSASTGWRRKMREMRSIGSAMSSTSRTSVMLRSDTRRIFFLRDTGGIVTRYAHTDAPIAPKTSSSNSSQCMCDENATVCILVGENK
jgi:hypothetical protein